MAELVPTASESEWLEARRKGVTASEIAVLMGLSPYSSPYALYHQKLGILPGQADSAVMERGRVLEPYVVEKFTDAHPEFKVWGDGRELYAHTDRSWQLATPDRILWGGGEQRLYENFRGQVMPWQEANGEPAAGVLETKTASDMSDWGEPGTDEIPVHYRAQVLWQCDVMGVRRWYVAVLDVPRWQVHVYTGEVDEAAERDLKLMRDAARDFLDRLYLQDPPDVDWRPATAYALKQLHPSVTDEDVLISSQLGHWYRAACRNYKRAEQKKKLYEARIREAMGSAHTASMLGIGREPLARRDVYEVGESVRKPYTVDKLVAVPLKKEKKSVGADSE